MLRTEQTMQIERAAPGCSSMVEYQGIDRWQAGTLSLLGSSQRSHIRTT